MQIGIASGKLSLRWMILAISAGCFFLVPLWSCWASPDTPWFVDMTQYAGSAHGTLRCEECHGPMVGSNSSHPDPKAADSLTKETLRTFDYQTCQRCHKTAHARSLKGEHARAAIKEKEEGKPSKTGHAPNCGDCHSAHYVKSHQSRVRIGKEMTRTCGACHPAQKMSFLANYHGRASVNLGYYKAAFCTDCHGAHTTLSLRDKTAALSACKRCHPEAAAEFADIIIHDSKKDLDAKSDTKKSGLRLVHILGTLSLIFVVAVLVFFYLHSGLLMLRKLQEKLRRHK